MSGALESHGWFSVSIFLLSVSVYLYLWCVSVSIFVSASVSVSVSLYLCLCLSGGQSSPYSLPQCPCSSLNPSTCLQLPILQLAGGSSLPNAPLSLTAHPLPLRAPLLQGSAQPCVVFQILGERNCLAASGQVSHQVWLWPHGPCLLGHGGFCKKEVQPEAVMSPGVQPSPSPAWHLLILSLDSVLEVPSPHTILQQSSLLLVLPRFLALAKSVCFAPHSTLV